MYHLKTGKVLLSRDIKWLNMMYGEYKIKNFNDEIKYSEYDNDDESSLENDSEDEVKEEESINTTKSEKHQEKIAVETVVSHNIENQDIEEDSSEDETEQNSPKLKREMKALGLTPGFRARTIRELRALIHNTYDEESISLLTEEETRETLESFQEEESAFLFLDEKINQLDQKYNEYGLNSAVESGYLEPKNFKDMLKRPREEKEKWLEGVKKELHDFETREVWKVVKRSEIEKGRRLIGCKWVFKLKRDGRYRARLVGLGYTQIPGVDYTDHFALVVSDVTLRIVFILWLIHDLEEARSDSFIDDPEF